MLIGIDIGGTSIKAVAVDAAGTVVQALNEPTATRDFPDILGQLEAIVGTLTRNAPAEAVGLGIPGLRTAATGVIESSPNLPILDGHSLEAALADRVRLPVTGRNDAEMWAWGEFRIGAGAGAEHLVCLTLGTGVGSGMILQGEIYAGSRGYAPEAGHMVVQPEGRPCPCGSHGCLETLASATAIAALARERMGSGGIRGVGSPGDVTAEKLHQAALQGDELAISIFKEVGQYLGIACANLIQILNPERILIGGGAAGAGDFLIGPAIAEARARTFRWNFESCQILPAQLGPDGGAAGAALYAGRRLPPRA